MTAPPRSIQINPRAIRRRSREFTYQLTRIKNWLVAGRITLVQAKALGKQTFDAELERLIAFTYNELKVMMRGIKGIPPDEMDRMEKWKEEELNRYYVILEDVVG